MKSRKVCLKNAKKVFPSEVTRVSPHDFMNLSVNKKMHLTSRERNLFTNMADQANEDSLVQYSDLLVIRKGKCITIKPM